ncbi:SoxY-related AACIE arm protein [Azospirillum sp.]|uniref:SoxY-related AACIE arm protein n=1 Tax=Azospirillum sp. TaxID=34012 RepID=UPI003D750CEA
MTELTRRFLLAAGTAVLLVRPAQATPQAMAEAIRAFAEGAARAQPGRVKLDLPALVENGNSAPLTVAVDSPMTPDSFVRRIAVFNEKNPQPNVAVFHLTPRSGRAVVSTRMRLADSQTIVAIAELSDGTFWSASAEVIVTLAACLEGG